MKEQGETSVHAAHPRIASEPPPALRESLGEGKIPSSSSQEGAPEVLSMGEEGDFKQRAQPHIDGLQGIEFETGT